MTPDSISFDSVHQDAGISFFPRPSPLLRPTEAAPTMSSYLRTPSPDSDEMLMAASFP